MSRSFNSDRAPLVDRRWPEFDLEPGPSSIGEFDDGVHFESFAVSVMQHRCAQRLAQHTQVTYHERFEEEPEEVEVLEEALGSDAQRRNGKGRINEVTLPRRSELTCRAQMRRPCRLVLDHHQTLERASTPTP